MAGGCGYLETSSWEYTKAQFDEVMTQAITVQTAGSSITICLPQNLGRMCLLIAHSACMIQQEKSPHQVSGFRALLAF